MDPALCRPGRFDRHVYVGFPDAEGREAILRVHTKRIRLNADVNLKIVSQECGQKEQKSGAQLACIVNEAALLAVRSGQKTVMLSHFRLAIDKAYHAHVNNLTGMMF